MHQIGDCRVGFKDDGQSVAIIAAHPDDEVLGLGARLPQLRQSWLFTVTNGAPPDGRDALRNGFQSNSAYARARRSELEAALALAGIECAHARCLEVEDQSVTRFLPELSRELAERLQCLRPTVVITHPYEGGHPDHDATAFAVHAACRLVGRRTGTRPAVLEMTSYHQGSNGIAVGTFLPWSDCPVTTCLLTDSEREFKSRLLDCFKTQRETLAYFPPKVERFRLAPGYDFTTAPHPGKLFYEHYGWGMTGEEFRAHAEAARSCLQLNGE